MVVSEYDLKRRLIITKTKKRQIILVKKNVNSLAEAYKQLFRQNKLVMDMFYKISATCSSNEYCDTEMPDCLHFVSNVSARFLFLFYSF